MGQGFAVATGVARATCSWLLQEDKLSVEPRHAPGNLEAKTASVSINSASECDQQQQQQLQQEEKRQEKWQEKQHEKCYHQMELPNRVQNSQRHHEYLLGTLGDEEDMGAHDIEEEDGDDDDEGDVDNDEQGDDESADAEAQQELDRARAERVRMLNELRAVREQMEHARKIRAERAQQHQDCEKSLEAAMHAREEARQTYPRPEWLTTGGCINVGVTGNSGVGKSSFINSVRGLRAKDPGAADVSPNETTKEPAAYDFPDLLIHACLWDLPGAGTQSFPRESYIKQMGLRYFDIVIIVTATRYTETEIMIANELRAFNVPFFMVRNKVDADIANNEDDHGTSAHDTLNSIKENMQRQGVTCPYLVSSKFSYRNSFDMENLKSDALDAIREAREEPQDTLHLTPVDGWIPQWEAVR